MALENTSLISEINVIAAQGPLPVHFEWTAVISTPVGDVAPLRVLGIDFHRNYVDNFCDEVFLDLAIGLGTYQQWVLPYATALTVTLKRTALTENGGSDNTEAPIETQTWRATLLKISSMAVEGNTLFGSSQDAGDLTSIETVTFQLLDQAAEQTRLQSVGMILKSSTVGDAIKYVVTKVAQGLAVDKEHQIKGVDMVPPHNTQVYPHLVIAHGTSAIDVPSYLAHHVGAPYGAGMGAYLQLGIWYIFPLYDLTRYDEADRTLTVINVAKNRMPMADRTYRKTYNQLIILATGDVKHLDPSDHLQLNHGNGARYADAQTAMEGFGQVAKNKMVVERVKNASEVITDKRLTGLNNVRMAASRITANPFEELSHLASRMGSIAMVTWQNSAPNEIFPGMPVRYLYEVNEKVFELKGTVLKTQTQISQQTAGLFPGTHISNTAVTMFVERVLDWSDAKTFSG